MNAHGVIIVGKSIAWASIIAGLVGCQQAEKPAMQTREMRIMNVLKDYGDRDFRDQVDMNQLQQMVQEDWSAQQALLLEQRAEIDSWAQDAMGRWKDSQTIYADELEKQLGENRQLINENTPNKDAADPLKDAEWVVRGKRK